MSQKSAYLNYLCARSQASPSPAPISVDEVIYFHEDDARTAVVTGGGEQKISTPLSELQPMLDPVKFRQVRRSTIVNITRIESITRTDRNLLMLKFRESNECITVDQPFCSQFLNHEDRHLFSLVGEIRE